MTSRNPSDELSEPRLSLRPAPGIGKAAEAGEVERWYGAGCWRAGWNWVVACIAAVVGPGEEGPVFDVSVRGVVVEEGLVVVVAAYAVPVAAWDVAAFWMADWALKAAKKLAKKGRLVVILVVVVEVTRRLECLWWCSLSWVIKFNLGPWGSAGPESRSLVEPLRATFNLGFACDSACVTVGTPVEWCGVDDDRGMTTCWVLRRPASQ